MAFSGQGAVGITYFILYAISLGFTLYNLSKHGIHKVGYANRRRPWSWVSLYCVTRFIGVLFSVDVARDLNHQTSASVFDFFYIVSFLFLIVAVYEFIQQWCTFAYKAHLINNPIIAADPAKIPMTRARQVLPYVFWPWCAVTFILMIAGNSFGKMSQGYKNEVLSPQLHTVSFLYLPIIIIPYVILYVSGRTFQAPKGYPYLSLLPMLPMLLMKVAYVIVSSFSYMVNPLSPTNNPAYTGLLGLLLEFCVLVLIQIRGLAMAPLKEILPETDEERGIKKPKPKAKVRSSETTRTKSNEIKMIKIEARRLNSGMTQASGSSTTSTDEITVVDEKGQETLEGPTNADGTHISLMDIATHKVERPESHSKPKARIPMIELA
ncbi:hypothetical protein SAICODRAFT_22626 [Saitoella complicata NRRL Y-17804]|uniref:Uncharacterized protein n=1 Tax=Saitoella complicata (strain BCRC 22490 / CBS 7301 / JCM 7358 / NBRC 10748 / NRRL Y-17804) TaxID=698492 RepID=A0A0E9NDA7_SAICN|nr:uncharacterized protein SAICODRAFT_22626 [Saitoella complicata NRRL Y-17804]ODQ56233.1 hypothetical protein SAICODRAFT_22626 [Saitoella complicata NRRL Y-17804]GAO47793.1 hypothetical protein G7K_1991-t1 [Saitoella complicata NRRL Y-17804]